MVTKENERSTKIDFLEKWNKEENENLLNDLNDLTLIFKEIRSLNFTKEFSVPQCSNIIFYLKVKNK